MSWFSKFLEQFGYNLIYVFIAIMCMNMIIFIQNPNDFCYVYVENSINPNLPVYDYSSIQDIDCRLVGNDYAPNNNANELLGFIGLIGWVLTSPRAKRLYRSRKIPYLQKL